MTIWQRTASGDRVAAMPLHAGTNTIANSAVPEVSRFTDLVVRLNDFIHENPGVPVDFTLVADIDEATIEFGKELQTFFLWKTTTKPEQQLKRGFISFLREKGIERIGFLTRNNNRRTFERVHPRGAHKVTVPKSDNIPRRSAREANFMRTVSRIEKYCEKYGPGSVTFDLFHAEGQGSGHMGTQLRKLFDWETASDDQAKLKGTLVARLETIGLSREAIEQNGARLEVNPAARYRNLEIPSKGITHG